MKNLKTILVVLLSLILVSCADTVDITKCVTDDPYGFFSGIWHGSIIILSFIGSWFSNDISIYSPNNTGFGYDLGFILGLGMVGKLLTNFITNGVIVIFTSLTETFKL